MDQALADPRVVPVPARFCAQCGTPAPTGDAPCPRCAVRAAIPAAPVIANVPLNGALILYFALLAVIAAGFIAGAVLDDRFSPGAGVRIDFWITGILSAVTAVACLPAWRYLAAPLATLGHRRWYLVAPALSLLTVAVGTLAMRALGLIASLPSVDYSRQYLDAGYSWLVPVLLVAVQPAVFEELAFRGVIGSAMQRVLGPRDAVIVTALLFATIHLSPASFPHLFVIGLALGYLRHRSGSLYPGMVLHFCHNGLVLLLEYLGV